MKKLYSFLAASLLVSASAGAEVTLPYSSGSFTTSPTSTTNEDGWSYVDKNADGTYWVSSTSEKYNGLNPLRMGMPNLDVSKDWLVSPKFQAEDGKSYKISFAIKTSNTNEIGTLKVYLSQWSPLVNEQSVLMEDEEVITGINNTTYTIKEATIECVEDGAYYFSLYFDGAQTAQIYIADINIVDTSASTEDPEDPETPEEPGEKPVEEGYEHTTCAGVSVPYSSGIAKNGSYLLEEWTVVDKNADSKTWGAASLTGTSNGLSARYGYSARGVDGDDYLISPAIHMEAGKEYRILWKFKTNSDTEKIDVYASTSSDPEKILAGKKLWDFEGTQQTVDDKSVVFAPSETADYHITYHAFSEGYKYYIYIGDFQVMENKFTPMAVTGLTAERADNEEVKITLNWTLPTKDVFGDNIPENKTFDCVEIYRDESEAPIATLQGAATTFDDTEATGLTPGKHTYSVVVTVAGEKSAATSVGPTAYCGPIQPTAVPCTFGMDTENDYKLFTTVVGENASQNVAFKYYYKSAYLNCVKDSVEDNWLISPPIAIETPGYYRVTFKTCYGTRGQAYKLEGYVGRSRDISAMTFCEDGFQLPYYNEADQVFDFYAAEAGTYFAALHACCPARETGGNSTQIYNMSVSTSVKIPRAVTNFTATPAANEALAINLTWDCPTKSFANDAVGDYKIEVYGDTLVTTLDAGTSSYVYNVTSTGVYNLTVKTYSVVDSARVSVPYHPSATTEWVGPKVVNYPYNIGFGDVNASIVLWNVVDANNDGKTWVRDTDAGNYNLQAVTAVDGVMDYNDYLVSPDIQIPAGYYKIYYQVRGGSTTAPFLYSVGLIQGEFNPENPNYIISEDRESTSTSYNTVNLTLQIPADGRYKFVFGTRPGQKTLSTTFAPAFKSFRINETLKCLPELVTDLKITPDAEESLEATISWINPTKTNITGVNIGTRDLTKAFIYRKAGAGTTGTYALVDSICDGLVPGQPASFVDNTIEEPGIYAYYVDVYTAEGKSVSYPTKVQSPWIGGGLELPYYGYQEALKPWVAINANGDTDYYYDPITWEYNNASKRLNIVATSSSNSPDGVDDWAYNPSPYDFEENNVYKIRYEAYQGSLYNDDFPLGICLGKFDGDTASFREVTKFAISKDAKNADTMCADSVYVVAVPADQLPVITEPETPAEGNEAVATDTEDEGDNEGDDEGDDTPEVDPLGSRTNPIKVAKGANNLAIHAKGRRAYLVLNKFEVTLEDYVNTGVEDLVSEDGSISYHNGTFFFDSEASVKVYDIAGTLLATGTDCTTFDINHLSNGVYIATVTINGKTTTLKVVL